MWCACFFCFKQKTAYEMRISDWSSDVCSSDLIGARRLLRWRELALIGFIGLDRQRRGGAPLPGVGGQHRIIEMDARRAVHQRMMDLLEGRDLPVGQPRYQRDLPQRSGAIEQPGMEPRGQLEHLAIRSEEHTSELQSLMRNSYAVFCSQT